MSARTKRRAKQIEADRLAATAKRKGRTVEEQARVESFLTDLFPSLGALADPDTKVTVGGVVIKEKSSKTN
jgi:hypothetical protein